MTQDELSAAVTLVGLLFPVWTVPILIILKLFFRESKGSLLLMAVSLPGTMPLILGEILRSPKIYEPGGWKALFSDTLFNPYVVVAPIVALICLMQFVLVLKKKIKEFSWISFRSIAGVILIFYVYYLIYFGIRGPLIA